NQAIADAANVAVPGVNAGIPDVVLPGNCGTTIQVTASTAFGTPVLRGVGINSSGLYALAPITTAGTPVTPGGDVWQRPSDTGTNNIGGGLRDMTVEAGALTSDGLGNGMPAVAARGGKGMICPIFTFATALAPAMRLCAVARAIFLLRRTSLQGRQALQ